MIIAELVLGGAIGYLLMAIITTRLSRLTPLAKDGWRDDDLVFEGLLWPVSLPVLILDSSAVAVFRLVAWASGGRHD